MEETLIRLIEQQPMLIYLTVLGVLFACGMGVPIPEDITLIAGGYTVYVAQQRGLESPTLSVMVLVGLVGVLSGDIILFVLGRYLGGRVTRLWPFRRMITARRMRRVQHFFGRYGAWTAFMARFAAGLRAPTFLLAGAAKMPFRVFALADGTAAMISVPLLVWIAWRFGAQIDRVKYWLKQSKYGLFALFGLIAIWLVVHLLRRLRRRRREHEMTNSASADTQC